MESKLTVAKGENCVLLNKFLLK